MLLGNEIHPRKTLTVFVNENDGRFAMRPCSVEPNAVHVRVHTHYPNSDRERRHISVVLTCKLLKAYAEYSIPM